MSSPESPLAAVAVRATGPLPRRSLHLTGACAIVTATGAERGPLSTWDQLGWVRGQDLVLKQGLGGGWQVAWLGPADAADRPACDTTLDLGGRLLVPGLCDAHTHAVFAGDRSGEFSQRMAGVSYAELAAAGGGIAHTVRLTRAATLPELIAHGMRRLGEMADRGVRVVEIKTGYGLDLASEVRLLEAIDGLRGRLAGRLQLVATAMPAHAVPPEYKADPGRYVEEICLRILPALAARGGVDFVDIFVERGYFDVAQAERIWLAARSLGLRLKAHVDEFADIGGLAWATGHRAVSVEHLLVTDAQGIQTLAASDTVAVCLPLTSLFLREGYAPMRALVDAGALVAIATDCNPGSAMSTNLPLALQIAVLNGRLTAPEALRGATRTAALALGSPGGWQGRIAVGEPFVASALEVDGPDALFYELGAPPRGSRVLDGLATA